MTEREKVEELQNKSSRMYAGFVETWLYDGEEWYISDEDHEEMDKIGAKLIPFRIFP